MAKTIFTAQKENLTDYQDLEKIKYVLNGETKYYTKEELTEYLVNLYRKNGVKLETQSNIDELVDNEIKTLKKYNGDPYGDVKGKTRDILHKLEAMGELLKIQ